MPYRVRSAWIAGMFSLAMASGADWKIDHVTAAGSRLEPMRAGLEKLGIHCEYGGPHANRATEMKEAVAR